ncbi:DUF2274 domain-containing protein [Alicycliphilus denitrificans]|uniref:DUF2274 domain-containing protein n=1 Tax=Alicycliphilus denitrificans TaxID=179636 RepID=A0A858ZVT2_9BURK|nr:DUF2274 domain-containing protein [Alicycliphilus denitrificans]QKD44908.1 DUF2274 domain-containing protein [Alicycliphilus denitrificans]
MSTAKLRLGPLPKSEPVKLTVILSAELKTTLDRYAALHAQTYGERVDAVTLVPYMLEAFMARDRGFRGSTAKRRTGS